MSAKTTRAVHKHVTHSSFGVIFWFTARLILVEGNGIAPKNLATESTLRRDSLTAHNMADNTSSPVATRINRDLASRRAHGKVFSKGKLSKDGYWRALPAPKEKNYTNFLFGFKCCKLEVAIGRNGADSMGLTFRHVHRDSSQTAQYTRSAVAKIDGSILKPS
ncbi:hypothetical protein C8F04DRAFT_1187442 [Mycena alexandri]|uniref:Uncharacterized protein n=1 Tax=Mycena alexandri TaxID=1745969 RepID=A0AAD6SKR7_9AGAR|nr:hypothetical protein C8F04DRAFT_1187442 [Mycena alexandri]